jgi:hypothetical protein
MLASLSMGVLAYSELPSQHMLLLQKKKSTFKKSGILGFQKAQVNKKKTRKRLLGF